MSIKSAFEKDFSEHDRHESSDFPKMSDHLTDSNILKSKKTYGRFAVCINNKPFPGFIEELYAEENSGSVTSITSSSYNKNNDQKEVNSEYSLFSDEVTDYISGSEGSSKDGISFPFLEVASSGSNYYRTRKNLKNDLNNEQNNSEEILKSDSDFLNLNQANHIRKDKKVSCGESTNELPQKPSEAVRRFLMCIKNKPSPDFIEELYAEENSGTATSITSSSYNKNNDQKEVNSEYSLFSDEVTDYISGSEDSSKDGISFPFLEVASSGSNYYRTRKNLKNDLNNEQNNSEKILKSDSDFLNLNQANHIRKDKKVSCGESTNELPQKPSEAVRRFLMCIKNKPSPDFIEELYAEENSGTATSITSSSYNKNNDQKEVNSEYSLFSDEVTDYISGSEDSSKDGISFPFLEVASSGSNYYRTRKNLKNDLNNEQNNSEEIFKSPFHQENSNYVTDTNELKSDSDFLNLNQANHIRKDKKVSCGESTNELPQKPGETSTVQVAKQTGCYFGKANFFENPLINQSCFSIVDLSKKYSVKNNQANASNNLSNKRITEECELAPVKKKSVANNAVSSKINSFDKETLHSTVSVRKSSKDIILKSINAGNLDVKKCDAKTPSSFVHEQNAGDFEHLAIPGPSTLSYNHSSMESRKCHTEIEPVCDISALIKKPTTTFLENPVYHKQEMRTGSFTSLGASFEGCANNYLQQTKNKCILKTKKMADEVFSRDPLLRYESVSEYFELPNMIDILSDFLGDCVSIPPTYHDVKKGYNFPENFERKSLSNLVKDFVQYVYFLLIPKDKPKPLNILYSQVMNVAVHKMSIRENAIVMKVFGNKSSLNNPFEKLKLDDVLKKLYLVALLVIFHEYKSRQTTSSIMN
ncbi:uncharacterized protein LOC129960884 [Argiope bruennichi]|uniref:uncharacterized protein LOC129960884 n=1 Tax=Argiope bruennichi TaxID=94029 RepID=UPI002494840C|nr:uncharacterized protein LOC129960884 [Argiope bruennichi]